MRRSGGTPRRSASGTRRASAAEASSANGGGFAYLRGSGAEVPPPPLPPLPPSPLTPARASGGFAYLRASRGGGAAEEIDTSDRLPPSRASVASSASPFAPSVVPSGPSSRRASGVVPSPQQPTEPPLVQAVRRSGGGFAAAAAAAAPPSPRRGRTPSTGSKPRGSVAQSPAVVAAASAPRASRGGSGTAPVFSVPPPLVAAPGRHTRTPSPPLTPASQRGSVEHARASGRRAPQLRAMNDACTFVTRVALVAAVSLALFVSASMLAAPLFINLGGPDDALARDLVPCIAELQSIHRVAPASLGADEARCLAVKALSEATESFARDTAQRRAADAAVKDDDASEAAHLRQVVRAALLLQHRVRLYARSRAASAWERFAGGALADAWRYAVERHDAGESVSDALLRPTLAGLAARAWDALVCLRQDEKMPCPSLAFVEERAARLSPSASEFAGLSEREKLVRMIRVLDAFARSSAAEYNAACLGL